MPTMDILHPHPPQAPETGFVDNPEPGDSQPTAPSFTITWCDTCNRIGRRTEPNPVIDPQCRYCGGKVSRHDLPDERTLRRTIRIHRQVRPVDYTHDLQKPAPTAPAVPMR